MWESQFRNSPSCCVKQVVLNVSMCWSVSGGDETERQHPGWVWSQERGPGIQKSWPRSSKCNFTSSHTHSHTHRHIPSASAHMVVVCPPVIFPEIRCNKVKHGEGPLPQGHPQLILGRKKRASWEDYLDIQACQLEVSPQLSGSKSCQYYFTL